jgi:hypothetical protein
VVATKTRKPKPATYPELIETAEALAAPIDLAQLVADGVLRKAKARGWYEILDTSRLPDHAWQKIKSVKSGNRVKFRKPSKRAAKFLKALESPPAPVAARA